MSASSLPGSISTTPAPPSTNESESIDYQAMFNSFNTELTSPFGSTGGPSPFSHQSSPFHSQTSPPNASNLGLERLVLNDSPRATFATAARSHGTGSPPFHNFNAMTNFTTAMPIETMLDTTAIGDRPYFHGSNVVTEQTARLMRHYIDNLASWMDLSDSRTHFSTVVPKRALTSVSI